jgi:hypothetical protein
VSIANSFATMFFWASIPPARVVHVRLTAHEWHLPASALDRDAIQAEAERFPDRDALADAVARATRQERQSSRAGVVWYSIDHANYPGEVPGIRIGRGIRRTLASATISVRCSAGIRFRDAFECLACLDEWQIPRSGRVLR